jgi:uncharacterized membrane protein YdjX (TVP38/TMEM64 family)
MSAFVAEPRQDVAGASAPAVPSNGSYRRALVLLFALVALALALAGRRLAVELDQIALWLDGLGIYAPLAFVGVYVLATVAFVPGSVLTLAAGALFGLGAGTVYAWVAATLGASLAFLVSRYAVRGLVEKRLATHPRFAALDRAVAGEGRRIAFLLRLSPVFPFNALNYALGATNLKLVDFVIACTGMLPGTLLYVYYGKLAGDVARATGGLTPERGPAYYAVLALGLVATVVVTTYVTRLARRAVADIETKTAAADDVRD